MTATWVFVFALVVMSAAEVPQKEDDSVVVVRSTRDIGLFENLEQCLKVGWRLEAPDGSILVCMQRYNA